MEHVILKPVSKQINLPQELLKSYFVTYDAPIDSQSRKHKRGISQTEIDKFFPSVLGLNAGTDQFNNAVNEWYDELSINLDFEGTALDTSLDDKGHPNNLKEYIIAKIASSDSNVHQPSEDESQLYFKNFQLVDKKKEKEVQRENFKYLKEAKRVSSTLVAEEDNTALLKNIAILLRNEISQTVISILEKDRVDMEAIILELADKAPEKFVNYTLPKNLDRLQISADAETYVDLNIVSLIGQQIVLDGDVIAGNMREFKTYLGSPKGSAVYNDLQNRFKSMV